MTACFCYRSLPGHGISKQLFGGLAELQSMCTFNQVGHRQESAKESARQLREESEDYSKVQGQALYPERHIVI
jgi:hypothetical protein